MGKRGTQEAEIGKSETSDGRGIESANRVSPQAVRKILVVLAKQTGSYINDVPLSKNRYPGEQDETQENERGQNGKQAQLYFIEYEKSVTLIKINQTMTKEQQATINSKEYWESVERKKRKLANQKPRALTDEQIAFLHKLSAKH